MTFKEYVETWRPFEIFTECLLWETDLEFYIFHAPDSLETDEKIKRCYENFGIYYGVIEKLGLVDKYLAFCKYIGESGLFGTE